MHPKRAARQAPLWHVERELGELVQILPIPLDCTFITDLHRNVRLARTHYG